MNFSATSGKVTRWAMVGVALLITAHRLPAPVQEISEAPAPAQTVRPAKAPKAKTRSESNAAKPTPAPTTTADSQRHAAVLAGKWSGTIQTVPWGPWAVTLTVGEGETSVTQQVNTDAPVTTVAHRNGEMLQARFPAGLTTITWSLTPLADGTTQVRFQAFANDFSTIFHRVAAR